MMKYIKIIKIAVIILYIGHCSSFIVQGQPWKVMMDSCSFYQEKQDFQTALNWAKLALPQAEIEFGKLDTNYVSTLGSVSEIFYYIGNLDSAICYGGIRLTIGRKIFKSDHSGLATSIGNMATFYDDRGNYKEAEPLYKEALGMYRHIFKGDHPDLATSICNMATFYYGRGNYKEAEPLFKEALDMRRRIFKGDHPDLATSICNMATFYYGRGNYKEAEPLFKEALEIRRRIFKGDHPDLASSINNLAFFYQTIGNYKEDESLFKEALEMYRRIFKGDHPDLANSINNLATFYYGRGNYKEAEPLFKEALEMRRRINKSDHPYLATSIDNMATFYHDRGNYKEAEPLFKEALEMRRRIFKGDNPDLARSINNMAYFYNGRGNYKEAEPLFKEALEMRRRIFKGNHPDLANSIGSMAYFYNFRGNYKEAEPLYKEALEMYRRIFKGDHPDLALSINNIATFYNVRGNYKEAEPLFIELIAVCYNLMNNYFPSLSEKEKEQFFNTFSKYFKVFNNFAVTRYKESPKLLEIMFDNQLLTKGMLLNATNKVRRSILSGNDNTLIELFTSWKDKKEYISKLYQLSKAQLEKKNLNLDSIVIIANDMEKELTKRSEVFKNEYDKQNFTWQDVQKSLAKDEAVVEIIRFNYVDNKRTTDTVYYAALILKPSEGSLKGGVQLVLLENGKDLEEKYFANYTNSIKRQLTDDESYSQFWAPVAKELKDIKRVYVSPDGVYNQINLATLRNPKTGNYLIDEQEIEVIGSSRDLVKRMMDSQVRRNSYQIVELFGDPKFNLDSAQHQHLAVGYINNNQADLERSILDSLGTRKGINQLPGTRKEVENIYTIFNTKEWLVRKHLGEEALEEALKTVNNPKILHIATHGMFLKDVAKDDERTFGIETKRFVENPLLRSMLLFAGAENTITKTNENNSLSKTDDGLLTAYEAMNLNLDKTELVVLSACETGLGTIKNGEGVYGLQRAFQQAGARTVLMSLWKVNDEATQQLMSGFYKNWVTGMTKREAFSKAQQEVRAKYKDPYFWGAFVMVGE